MIKSLVLVFLYLGISNLLLYACTEPNPGYQKCSESELGCPTTELCNALDDDQDGMIDEDLDQMCLVLLEDIIQGDSEKSYFAHHIVSIVDQNQDGVQDLLVSTNRPQTDILQVNGTGSLYLIDGQTQEVIWSKQGAGDFAHVVAVGDFNNDQVLEIAVSAPTAEKEDARGKISFLNLQGEVLNEYWSTDASGLGLFMATLPLGNGQGDALLLSEPYKDFVEDSDTLSKVGHIMAMTLSTIDSTENQPTVLWNTLGTQEDQQLGSTLYAIFDPDQNTDAGFITSIWREKDGVQQQQLWWLNTTGDELISPFSVPENTLGTMAQAMTWGYFHSKQKASFVFSIPSIEINDEVKGRTYIVTPSKEAEESFYITGGLEGYGQALLTIPSDPSRGQTGEYLIIASDQELYIMNPNQEVEQSIDLPHSKQPVVITKSSQRTKQGYYDVWLGFPQEQRIYHMSVR